MAYAVAIFPEPTPFERLVCSLDECCRVIVRGIALCLGAVATVAATMAFVTVMAAWFVAAAFSMDPHLSAKAPIGAQQMAFGGPRRIEIAAADRAETDDAIATASAVDDASTEADLARPAATSYVLASVAPALPAGSFERANFVRLPSGRDDPPVQPRPAGADIPVAPASEGSEAAGSLVTAAIAPEALPRSRPPDGAIWLRDVDSRTAVYDIAAHTVYMPDGTRLEAHSGLGPFRDDPRHVRKKMRGATPPNVYKLTLRERLFHGVRAIRLNPVSVSAMHGRDGMLAHTYMLGPSGQSNGCVAFKNYNAFLQAFLRGEVTRMVVVPRVGTEMSLMRSAQRASIE